MLHRFSKRLATLRIPNARLLTRNSQDPLTVGAKLGGFDGLYDPFYWEDIDLSYRAQKSGYKVIFEPKSIVTHEHEKGTVKEMFEIKRMMFDFLVEHGWAKAEWDEDVRIRQQQEEAVKLGTLTAASGLSYAGH